MYLKSLRVQGFKSFANKTNLDFKTRITSVVGPNGSGKSNIAESFRFVLGEQSLKNMRGKKGEDLIFSGRKNRLNRASVKIVFDNSDKKIDLDYNEVVIERVVYRDGVNEYLINGSKVRAKDIIETLGSANIGSSGHHIISQGEADRILSLSPKERKVLLEDALGLKSFVFRKQDAERKLIRVEKNTKEIKIQERVNAPRIRFLKREVEKIQKIKDLKEELQTLYVEFFPLKKQNETSISELKKEIDVLEKEVSIFKEKIVSKNKELQHQQNTDGGGDNTDILNKIEIEIKTLEDEKEVLQKTIFQNDLIIESETLKRQRAISQQNNENQIKEQYSNKKKKVASIFHDAWVVWAKKMIDTGELSSDRHAEWEKKFVEYAELSDEEQVLQSDSFAKRVLDELGISLDIKPTDRYDEKLVEKKTAENKAIEDKIILVKENIDSSFKKKRILGSSSDNAQEVFNQEVQIEILKIEKQQAAVVSKIAFLYNKKNILMSELNNFHREETFALSFFGAEAYHGFLASDVVENNDVNYLHEKIVRIRAFVESLGDVENTNIETEYTQLKEAQEFVKKELEDLDKSKMELNKLIVDVAIEVEKRFKVGVEKINTEFSDFFKTLFVGGSASLFLIDVPIRKENEDDIQEFELGLDLKIELPNKKIKGLGMLSGGERSLTSIALLFAMSSITPPPFIILDETDAALDEANSKKYGDMVEKLSEHSQLILITHNRETMSRADILYGVTMTQDGASKLLSVSLEQASKVAK